MSYLPTIRQLQFLCALADQGTFSKAADACLVAQPTLSAAVRQVEAALGIQLVERGSRSTRLTPAGEAVVARARRILAEAADLVSEAHQASAPLAGPFRLGAIPTIAPFVLPKTLRKLRQSYPDLKLLLREEKSAELVGALKSRTLDAAIIALPWPTPGIEVEVIQKDEFLLAMPNGHPLAEADTLKAASLLGEQVLLLEEGHCMRGHAEAVCTMPGIERRNDVSATSLQTMIQMVGGGLGLSLVPKIASDAGVTRGAGVTVRGFDEEVPGRTIAIAWRKGSSRKEEAQLIANIIRAQVQKP